MAESREVRAGDNLPITQVVVVGAGWVGRQIVGQFAAYGVTVYWLDRVEASLKSGMDWLVSEKTAALVQGFWPEDDVHRLKDRVTPIQSIKDSPDGVQLVLESVSEQISVKRKVLQEASRHFPAPVIIASNSSYFTPSMLDRFVESPDRFAHLHFHVPVWRTKLVDVAASPKTSETTLARLKAFSEQVGQRALVERVENPGYVFNWMLRSLLQSAIQLHAKQVATPEDIDFAWRQVTGMELGPFGIMDQIGIDLIHQTMSAARFVDGDEQWQPLIDKLQPLIDQNRLGVKTGGGFYDYPQALESQAPEKPSE